jgi:hypothetical protein
VKRHTYCLKLKQALVLLLFVAGLRSPQSGSERTSVCCAGSLDIVNGGIPTSDNDGIRTSDHTTGMGAGSYKRGSDVV